MGFLFGLLAGFVLGFSVVAGLMYMMVLRSRQRTIKAEGLLLLGQLNQGDVKRLCDNNYPSWLSFTTFERVKWLNMQLKKIWPSVALAASKLIEMAIEPMLVTYCPPGFQMKFAKLFLGNVAPQIEGIKIQTIQRGQLIMDLDFKWGGDPSIILAIQTPVGAKLPIQLKDLKFFATVRVIFKLFEGIPCIAGVAIALLDQPKPEIRYTLKLIGGSISSVPGISDVIKDIVETAVTDTIQWPHRIVIPIAQPLVDLSDLELKLQGKLTLTIIRADSLRNLEVIGKSDPYVIAYVRVLFKCKTQVVENSLNPEWNETFEFNVEDKETQFLVLQVMDKDVGADKLVGVAVVPIAKLKNEVTKLTLNLAPSLDVDNTKDTKDCGSISVSVKYHVFTPEEQAACMEAEKAFLEARKAAAGAGFISGTMDVIGGAVEGAGKLVADGASIMGTGVGMVGTGLGKAGKFVSKSVSDSLTTRQS